MRVHGSDRMGSDGMGWDGTGWDGMGGCKRMRCGAGVDKIAEDFLPQFNYVEPSVLQALQLSHAIPWHTTHIGTKAACTAQHCRRIPQG
jgi:hypothetical protein